MKTRTLKDGIFWIPILLWQYSIMSCHCIKKSSLYLMQNLKKSLLYLFIFMCLGILFSSYQINPKSDDINQLRTQNNNKLNIENWESLNTIHNSIHNAADLFPETINHDFVNDTEKVRKKKDTDDVIRSLRGGPKIKSQYMILTTNNSQVFMDRHTYKEHREELRLNKESKRQEELKQLIQTGRQQTAANSCKRLSVTPEEYFTASKLLVNQFDNIKYILQPDLNYCGNNTYLLIFVSSHYANYAQRNEARKSWAIVSNINRVVRMRNVVIPIIKVIFVLAQANSTEKNNLVAAEHRLNRDILQVSIEERYENLIFKSIIGLKWTKDHCPSITFLMKVDDDILVNIPLLINKIRDTRYLKLHPKYILGHCYPHSNVFRQSPTSNGRRNDHTKAWVLSCAQYPLEKYPDYTAGHGYIMTSNLIAQFYSLAERKQLFPIEDVFVTGILRKMAGYDITLRCLSGFSDAFDFRPNGLLFPEKSYTFAVKVAETVPLWEYLLNYKPNNTLIQDKVH